MAGASSASIVGAAGGPSSPTASCGLNSRQLKETVEADHFWEQYQSKNDTVIANTFAVSSLKPFN